MTDKTLPPMTRYPVGQMRFAIGACWVATAGMLACIPVILS